MWLKVHHGLLLVALDLYCLMERLYIAKWFLFYVVSRPVNRAF